MWQDPEYRQQMAKAHSYCLTSTAVRQRLSEAIKAAWARGAYGEACLLKMSAAGKARWQDPEYRAALSGKNNHLWRDGASLDPYPPEWCESLRQAVRERDGFTCILCGETQNGRALDVHHIDEDKQNSDMSNLVTLCAQCHRAVHADDFDAYRVGFQALFACDSPLHQYERTE